MADVRPPLYTPHPAVNPGAYQQQYGQPSASYTAANIRGAGPIHNVAADQALVDQAEDLEDSVTGSKQGYVDPKIPREYMRLDFQNCFQDHSTTRAIPMINQALDKVFTITKLMMYNLLVILIGFPTAFFWALGFASIAFFCTYILSPFIRMILIFVHVIMPLATETTRSLLYPLGDAIGRIFRQIQIKASLDGGLNIQKNTTTNRPAQNV